MQLKTLILTLFLAALLPLSLMAQSNITEPGATNPNQLYTTTYDNPSGPNQAPGGPNRASMEDDWLNPADGGYSDPGSPIGAPWILLGFAAAYGAFRLKKS